MSPTIRMLLAALLLAPAAARAQTGRIAGTIIEAGGAPLAGTQIILVVTNQGASTDAEGRYTITNVTPGTYVLRALRIGHRPKDVPAVVVRPGEETRVDVALDRAPLELAGVVVSASRRVEKVTDAPATITRIDAVDIENTVGNSFAPALKAVPAPFLEMRLDAGGGREAEPGEPGELLLRGPQMFAGYFGDPARTAEVLDVEGWLHTGDLASRDADGAYRICGRKKEMYISGGENVFPGEVEAALAGCPGVSEVVVVGVPDAKWGEVGRAFVVPRAGCDLTGEEVVAHARGRLAGYKVPKSVVILDEMPRLGSGKADRGALAALVAPAPAG